MVEKWQPRRMIFNNLVTLTGALEGLNASIVMNEHRVKNQRMVGSGAAISRDYL
jgi:hypothetical protein